MTELVVMRTIGAAGVKVRFVPIDKVFVAAKAETEKGNHEMHEMHENRTASETTRGAEIRNLFSVHSVHFEVAPSVLCGLCVSAVNCSLFDFIGAL
jgi:hypothetical protein